jgi:excisionase family DNA binding protein
MDVIDEDRRRLKGSGNTFELLTAPIPDACLISGLSRSELYRCLADGRIRAVKSGKRTLILVDSLRAHIASLPVATFRRPKAA